jgi:uncharacterized protein DUF2019
MAKETIHELLDEYARNAALHDELAVACKPARQINKAHDRVLRAFQRILQQYHDDGLKALAGLLEHDNRSVRLWSATHCMRVARDDAVRVLSELEKERGSISFEAMMILRQLENGTFRIRG